MIYYPKIFGTCAGANTAIKLAFDLKEKFKNKRIFIYKEILHNPYVIELLKKSNIECIDDLTKLKIDDILIIRAHGEPKSTYEYLNKKKINYHDATCIKVKMIHEIVEENYNKGKKIIIVGKKDHPEVIGTNGWCNNEAIIIENKDDYKKLNDNNYFIVCQTTINKDKLDSLINYLNDNNISYEYKNTICNASKLIQSSSVDITNNLDIMFVIGGKNSSNTKELYNVCNEKTKTYYFSNIENFYDFIIKENYSENTRIGFTGGASTLKEQVYDYSNLLQFVIYYKNKLKELIKEIKKYNNSLLNNTDNRIIKDAINKFIEMNKDGKFIRGCLIDLGYKLHNNDNYSTPLSIAYETFETSILIHDDIIDNADVRRGKKTIHEKYKDDFNKYKIDSTPTSLALCIGDLGLYYSNQIIVDNYKNDKNLSKILHYYNEIIINTIKGEILDVYLPFIEKNDKNHKLYENDILEIYKLKTSYYTIVGPFILGMILGNSSTKEINTFKDTLLNLGIAFQIKDDILGVFGDNKLIGKSTSSDIEEFKQTILYSYIKINKKEYLNDLLKYYGKKNKSKEIQKIFKESGALEYANKKMNEMFNEVKNNINKLNIKEDIKQILLGFIKYLEIRKK